MFKDRTYVKDRTIFVSPESCVSEGYSEKEIFLDNPVVVSSVAQSVYFENGDYDPEIFPRKAGSDWCESRPIPVFQRKLFWKGRGYVLGRTYVNAARVACVKGYFERTYV